MTFVEARSEIKKIEEEMKALQNQFENYHATFEAALVENDDENAKIFLDLMQEALKAYETKKKENMARMEELSKML